MHPRTVELLLSLNHKFYQTFALQFAQTRHRLQPGVRRILPDLLQARSVLDLGCGNGELARQLLSHQYSGLYLGLDFSTILLEQAQAQLAEEARFHFHQADLSKPDWINLLPREIWERVVAFAVLHHIPGEELRVCILRQVRKIIDPNGRFILSNWQFLNSPRLRARVQTWDQIGLNPSDVDEGDYLLDWRFGGEGLRYVHHFHVDELNRLAADTAFSVEKSFWSDGEGGCLGLYQIWKPI